MDWLLLLQSTGGWVFHLRIWSDTAWSQATWGNKSSDFCFKLTPFLLLVFPVLFQVLTSSLAIIHVWLSVPGHCAEMTSYLLLHSQIPWHSALSSTSKVLISFPAELRTGWISDRVLLTPSLTGSRKCKEIPLCCLGFPGCFHWPQWGVKMEHQLSWWKLSLSFHRDSEILEGDSQELQKGRVCADHPGKTEIPASYWRSKSLQ